MRTSTHWKAEGICWTPAMRLVPARTNNISKIEDCLSCNLACLIVGLSKTK